MDDLLSCVEAHLSSRGLEGFSDNGAQSLAHIVKTLQRQEEESPVVHTALAQIRKAIRPLYQRPPPALVRATADRDCEVNGDRFKLLQKCEGNPSAIFESQGSGTPSCAVHNLLDVYQLGTQLFNGPDDLRRHVFCIIISDAHDIANKSESSKRRTAKESTRAIARLAALAACFKADGVEVPLRQLRKDLQQWVTCGAGHQLVMKSLGDGYLTTIPSSISIGILEAEAHDPNLRAPC